MSSFHRNVPHEISTLEKKTFEYNGHIHVYTVQSRGVSPARSPPRRGGYDKKD